MKTGYADLPLHYGKAPRWLFSRMTKLGGAISELIVNEYGQEELLRRLSDPFWFQAFGCVLGFDWHSSGLTTTVCGALKIALKERNLGVQVCGGKGSTSLKTPQEIENTNLNLTTRKIEELKKASRLSAKVDNALLQDGFQLYHHTFIFTEQGKWAVIQQGLNGTWARRYHWLHSKNLIEEPHSGFYSDHIQDSVLNLTAKESRQTREKSLEIVKEGEFKVLVMPKRHEIKSIDLDKRGIEFLKKVHDLQPETYEDLLLVRGMGPKTIRALALVSNIVYGTEVSWKDPVKYSYAHGGKDGTPYPVDKSIYDKSIIFLEDVLKQAKLDKYTKLKALKRLNRFFLHG